MRFKFIVISVLLLIAAYSFFWFQIAGKVKEDTLAWIENSKNSVNGVQVFVGDITVSGFPYKIAIEASSLDATLPKGQFNSYPISVNFPTITAVYQPWKPNHIIVVTDYFDATIGDLLAPVSTLNFDKIKSSVILDADTFKLDNLSIVAEKVTWQNEIGSDTSSMEMAELHLRQALLGMATANNFDLPINKAVYFKAKNADIYEFKASILGQYADDIIIEATLHANQQPDFTKKSLSFWRDEGGTISIKTFDYGTTNSHVNLSGDVTLDENLKPLGAFDAKLSGLDTIFRALSQNENISQTGRLILQSQSQDASGQKDVQLSISMQNGMMYLGQIPILELESIIN